MAGHCRQVTTQNRPAPGVEVRGGREISEEIS